MISKRVTMFGWSSVFKILISTKLEEQDPGVLAYPGPIHMALLISLRAYQRDKFVMDLEEGTS